MRIRLAALALLLPLATPAAYASALPETGGVPLATTTAVPSTSTGTGIGNGGQQRVTLGLPGFPVRKITDTTTVTPTPVICIAPKGVFRVC